MPKRVIQDEREVQRWIEEGRTFAWMVDQYRSKYHIEASASAFTNLRSRRGWARRETRNDNLIPWHVDRKHRWKHPLAMLRLEARVRTGEELTGRLAQKHASFMARLRNEGLVVYYDPDTDEGFYLIPREEFDTDIVRQPPLQLRTRRQSVE